MEILRYPGLFAGQFGTGPEGKMPTFVSHNSVGLNYMERGAMRVLFASGVRYRLEPATLAVFWGAIPHRVEAYENDSYVHFLALPLGTFLRWSSLGRLADALLRGRVFFEADSPERLDLILLKRWQQDLRTGGAESKAIVELELEGRLRRLARSSQTKAPRVSPNLASSGPDRHVDRMFVLIAEHFREESLGVADVAEAVGLNADYASRLFHHSSGMKLTQYLAECRVSHAKAMLATTDTNVLDVAIESGFGSVGRFHAVFKQLCGCTPSAYRKGVRVAAKE